MLNPTRYRLPFANKLVFNRVFGGAGLPVARSLGVYDPVVGWWGDGGSLRNVAELQAWLDCRGCNGFVFKSVWGSEGYQVMVFIGRDPARPGGFLSMAGESHDAGGRVWAPHC